MDQYNKNNLPNGIWWDGVKNRYRVRRYNKGRTFKQCRYFQEHELEAALAYWRELEQQMQSLKIVQIEDKQRKNKSTSIEDLITALLPTQPKAAA